MSRNTEFLIPYQISIRQNTDKRLVAAVWHPHSRCAVPKIGGLTCATILGYELLGYTFYFH